MQDRIDELETQDSIDRTLIARLRAEGLIDRTKIVNLEATPRGEADRHRNPGILMVARKLSEVKAFETFRCASQRTDLKLRDQAKRVLCSGTLRDLYVESAQSASDLCRIMARSDYDAREAIVPLALAA